MMLSTLIVVLLIFICVVWAITPKKCIYFTENEMMCENNRDCDHCAYYRWRERGRD